MDKLAISKLILKVKNKNLKEIKEAAKILLDPVSNINIISIPMNKLYEEYLTDIKKYNRKKKKEKSNIFYNNKICFSGGLKTVEEFMEELDIINLRRDVQMNY